MFNLQTPNLAKYKKPLFVTGLVLLVVTFSISLVYYTHLANGSDVLGKLISDKSKVVNSNNIKPTRLGLVYVPQTVENTSTYLTDAQVVSKFQLVIYSRNKMITDFSDYKTAGFTGPGYVYLTALDRWYGPSSSYASVSGQSTTCTQTTYQPSSNTADMDPGDFCEVHNAIKNHTCLAEYTDICPTESFFLHKSDGSRYVKGSSTPYSYKPNPADTAYRKYVAYRAVREMVGGTERDSDGTTRSHPKTDATGVFYDNLELTWSKVLSDGGQPKEFSTSQQYADAVAGLISYSYSALHDSSKGYNFPLWANMISSTDNGSDWDRYITDNSLDGAFMENFALDWGRGPYSSTKIENQMTQIEKWLDAGKKVITVSPDNLYYGRTEFDKQAIFTLALNLLVNDGVNTYYKLLDYYGNPSGSRSDNYNEHFDYDKYLYALGIPVSGKTKTSTSPLIYSRNYECGSVSVNLTTFTGTITYDAQCPNSVTDVTPPSLQITSPVASGTYTSSASNLTISVSATDSSGVTKVEFYVNGVKICTDTSAPFSCKISANRKKNSTLKILVKAYDPNNNVVTKNITITNTSIKARLLQFFKQ